MARTIRFTATASAGEVTALLDLPQAARALYVVAHGAGAGMRSAFLEEMARRLGERRLGTLRFQFPHMEQGRKRPGPPAVDQKTVRSAVAEAARLTDLPLVAGGKSYGGRMSAYAAAGEPLAGVLGLAFLGFPLHPPGRPGSDRWEPMTRVRRPMLFLQGTRDSLASLELLRPLVCRLEPRARLHVVEGANHSFQVPKRSGRSPQEVLDELADALASWTGELVGSPTPVP